MVMEEIGKTTSEAFKELVGKRSWYKDTAITEQQATNYKARFKDGSLTIDKMEEVLLKCGKKVVQEKLWK